jgi:hypothetical protein
MVTKQETKIVSDLNSFRMEPPAFTFEKNQLVPSQSPKSHQCSFLPSQQIRSKASLIDLRVLEIFISLKINTRHIYR